ncbi:MAG: tRNA (uracil-5-)-methyltransferase [Syntrophotaleaceae bacterium]
MPLCRRRQRRTDSGPGPRQYSSGGGQPPRSGCQTEVLEALAKLAPGTIIYVSCNPGTLARDLDLLQNKGYDVTALQPVDMFPQTAHLETVVQLRRRD